jgi:hypothetical protein
MGVAARYDPNHVIVSLLHSHQLAWQEMTPFGSLFFNSHGRSCSQKHQELAIDSLNQSFDSK